MVVEGNDDNETEEKSIAVRRSDHLEVIGYSNLDFAGCVDTRKSILGFAFLLVE